ncbi:MAG: hypothetical protein LBQ77_03660 [Treponema sp.]|nr:hypothetical protein [Treponema sp.]
MKRFMVTGIFILMSAAQLHAYPVYFKEQFYRLFHMHYIQYPDNTMENIYWLEKALAADFANPLYAVARIENELEWEKYRYLFMMHLNLKMIEQYIFLGNKWNKRNAYFYNAPFKEQNLESLKTTEACYKTALYYWNEALTWAEKARERRFRFIDLKEIQFWQDEMFRIEDKTLDYEHTINRELASLEKIRDTFESMDTTY